MSRHIADHQAPSDGGRTKHFFTLEKSNGAENVNPKVQQLTQRPHSRAEENRRAVEFMRIARGHQA